MSIFQFAADDVRSAPSAGGRIGTYLTVPPGISMLLRYLQACQCQLCMEDAGAALIKEWLKDNDLVALFNKAHECA
jgi:hypothetical protein